MKRDKPAPTFLQVFCGTALFFAFQYATALVRLGKGSGAMENKFSVLAKDKFLSFLILENLFALAAYFILAILFSLVLQPLLAPVCRRFSLRKWSGKIALALAGAFLIHGFFVLRLVETRPYFLNEGKFGYWYYQILNAVPESAKPAFFLIFFTVFPLAVAAYAAWWHLRRLSGKGRAAALVPVAAIAALFVWKTGLFTPSGKKQTADSSRPNVIIIGSDSLRGDRLGCNGYHPRRTDGLAAAGVSPRIDALAAHSVNFTECYTPIASTLESGTSLMAAQYPHTHGFRHMYPDEKTVAATKASIEPIAPLLAEKGYDTAAFGDWCAGYYQLMPMGMETISVSSFDNFKIYMSQAVVMAHFVIPLYFDHPLGYTLFPQLGSFAQFVTPGVVTSRVEKRLSQVRRHRPALFLARLLLLQPPPVPESRALCLHVHRSRLHGAEQKRRRFRHRLFHRWHRSGEQMESPPEKEIQQIRDLYDGCTRQFDDHVGKILDALESKGLSKNTIVLVTADHGDNLYEEGTTLGHGLTFNGPLNANHVPLVFHLPGRGPEEIPAIVRTIDIIPTIADLTGITKPASWEGRSFAPWLDGSESPHPAPFTGNRLPLRPVPRPRHHPPAAPPHGRHDFHRRLLQLPVRP